jgi:hypothetical protein
LVAPGPHLHGTFNTAAVPAATNSPTTRATQAIRPGPRGRIHIGCHGWSADDTERGLLRDRRGASQPGEAQPGHTDAAVEVRSLGALAVINVTDNGVGGASLAAATGWPGRPAARRGWHHDRLVTGRRTDLADRNPPPGSGLTPRPLPFTRPDKPGRRGAVTWRRPGGSLAWALHRPVRRGQRSGRIRREAQPSTAAVSGVSVSCSAIGGGAAPRSRWRRLCHHTGIPAAPAPMRSFGEPATNSTASGATANSSSA